MELINSYKIKEIIWLSRGGQGAKTAALLLGEAALASGFFIQVFPEYGPERSGAPMKVYNRISNNFIRFRTPIEKPDIVIVLDSSLLKEQSKKFLVDKNTVFLINHSQESDFAKDYFQIQGEIITFDASEISKKILKKPIPSIAMLGALIGFLNFNWRMIELKFKERLAEKLGKDLVDPNMEVIIKSFKIMKDKIKNNKK